jgi:hypothetical protein
MGRQALLRNTTGRSNTPSGIGALERDTTGSFNTASLLNPDGYQNTPYKLEVKEQIRRYTRNLLRKMIRPSYAPIVP